MSEQTTEILSPDGNYRWDGAAWQPITSLPPLPAANLAPSHRQTSSRSVVTKPRAIFAAVLLVAAAGGGYMLLGGKSAPSAKASVFRACDSFVGWGATPGAQNGPMPAQILVDAAAAANKDSSYRQLQQDLTRYQALNDANNPAELDYLIQVDKDCVATGWGQGSR